MVLNNGSRFVLNNLNSTIKSLNSAGATYTDLGVGTLTLADATGGYEGAISSGGGISGTGQGVRGVGLLNLTGGTMTLTSTNGQVDGPRIRVANGVLTVNANVSKLADDTWVELATGGSLAFGNSNSLGEIIASITGSGVVQLGADRTLTLTQGGGTTLGAFSGAINGTGSSGLTLAGGSLILSATQGYTGATTIRAGAELVIDTGSGAGTSTILPDAGSVVTQGGTIRVLGDKTETLGAVTFGTGVNRLSKGLVSSGKIDIGSPTLSLELLFQLMPVLCSLTSTMM